MTAKILSAAIAAVVCAGAWAQEKQTVWDGVYSAKQAERGQIAYGEQCARCHGTQLTGGESAPPLSGVEFSSSWNGLSLGDLFERIRISMPADRPARLPREQNADIIAYILRVNQFPAGETDLASRAPSLSLIQMEMFRPEKAR